MQRTIYNYLSQYYEDAEQVDCLIVCAFLKINNLLPVKNRLLNEYLISDKSGDQNIVDGFMDLIQNTEGGFTFEHLIELFEFVVSPADKIVNGAVYTPKNIRNYIVESTLRPDKIFNEPYRLADIACGCGGFLLEAAEKIRNLTGRSFLEIFKTNLYGVDIMPYSIVRSKILLTLFAIYNGEDVEEFTFNLYTGNSLVFDWKETIYDTTFNGFQCIVGNPPYVASRNMDENTLELLSNWSVASSGHPDLYIPFFQIGFELLAAEGIMGLITVNTFIKSINGRALRQYFADHCVGLKILNFGGEQVFKDRSTYTCICLLQRQSSGIEYIRCSNKDLYNLNLEFANFRYEDLNHSDGWNLVNSRNLSDILSQIERVGLPFKSLYDTKNGIATLKNQIYKFRPVEDDENYFYLSTEIGSYPIEKGVCRNIVNANKIKEDADLIRIQEKIIFPYVISDGKVQIIEEDIMQSVYPKAYEYLSVHKEVLAKRDKSKKRYETWYAYGRRQSMDIKDYKLFFPHICERPRFVISDDADLLFYNGIAVVSKNLQELLILKRLLESELFYFYIKNTTKDYSSGYISLSRNYLKNFGVYQFTEEEAIEFLSSNSPEEYLKIKYGVSIP